MKNNNTKPFYNTTIPSDWDSKSFKIAKLKVIDGDRGKNYPSKNELFDSGHCIFLSAKNVTTNGFSFIEKAFITKEKDDLLSKGKLTKYDLVMTTRGSVGHIAFFDDSLPFENLRINSGMVILRNENDEIENEYLYKYCSSFILQNQILKISFGSAQPQLTVKEIAKFLIPIPPLPEQKAIAKALSLMDTAINLNNQLIAQKELRKKWLMQNLLTGKKRLKGFSGEWKEVRIDDVTTNFSKRNKELIDAKVYSVTNSNGFVLQSEHFEGKVAGEDLSNYKIIKKNEFAYNPARINVGSLAYFVEEIGVISSLYVCFRTKKEVLDYYLLQFLQLDHTKYRINALGEGGVRVYLWYDLFSKIKINIPSIEEQAAIAQVLQTADKEIELLKAKTDKLKEQKKGMMQVLLTGKKRLNCDSFDFYDDPDSDSELKSKKSQS